MKKLIFANWKCYKTVQEVREWMLEVGPRLNEDDPFRVVACVPFVYLHEVGQMIADAGYEMDLGAQDIAKFEEGAYTGEVSGKMLESVGVKWVLIGHSERRSLFGETNEDCKQKVVMARRCGIEPVLLVRSSEDELVEGVSYFGWEPVSAIGTGNAIQASEAESELVNLKNGRAMHGLYGGSVKIENIADYFAKPEIEGAVIGSASLDGHKFIQLINAIR